MEYVRIPRNVRRALHKREKAPKDSEFILLKAAVMLVFYAVMFTVWWFKG